MTGNDVINAALRRIACIPQGENPTAAEAAAGLEALNDMLDSWMTERLMVFSIQRQSFTLTTLKQSYTVGPGGDFDIPRPARIERIGIVSLQNPAQPMELPIPMLTAAQWSQIPVKQVSASLPTVVWDDNGYPWRTLSFWSIPNQAVAVALYIWAGLGSFVDLVTDYEFPPGYALALKDNLAYRLAMEFSLGQMPPQLPELAIQSRARIKAMNTPLIDLRCDDAIVASGKRNYNWMTDSPIGSR